ncbi:hypothetical protein L873DRAFT_1791521 [Choiromyces venosus 120613-1]|uniref:Chromo domain-containing protein n=1 Tax=Choiromyces venosus 120613-1 TaxID=1336337 RepID=A0A3N4JES1_9PEZI|nr:hypothetical protein L873DRAFT_1791521 [Choiromyces venosus 120613-1]
MPPQIVTSDSDSDGDIIAAKAPTKDLDAVSLASAEEDGVADIPDDDEEYVVEAIKNHRYTDKKLYLLVKWKGYERKSDMTWEPEENCEGAKEILQAYYNAIGGRPTLESSPVVKGKRGRLSSGSTPAAVKAVKRAKTSTPAATTKNGKEASPAGGEPWNPPKGSWEEEIICIDTIEKTDKGLVCYVQWQNGRKSQHEISTVYRKCPQTMLRFYEQHLVFKESGSL